MRAAALMGWLPPPVQLGLVTSLSRPGGNLTGVVTLNVEVTSRAPACRSSTRKDPDDCRNNVKMWRRIWIGKQEPSKAGYVRTRC
jgi:hypothetical protein